MAEREATIVFGRVIGAYFVYDFGIRLQHTITMGEPFRYEDLVPVGSAQRSGEMATKARRTPAYVDSDIEDRARRYPQQLCLSKRRNLEVETANDPHTGRKGVIVLHEVDFNPVFSQYIFLEDF